MHDNQKQSHMFRKQSEAQCSFFKPHHDATILILFSADIIFTMFTYRLFPLYKN